MYLYNALTRRKEKFELVGEEITIYVCGITPYDTTHLGHGFTYATFDVLIRYLESQGHKVRYAQNVTDIDDDVLRRARTEERNWLDLGNQWTRHFIDDNKALNLRAPDYFPRATEVISQIVNNVERLIGRGVAYESGGSVYFEIDKDPTFGQLSQLSYVDMVPVANERGNRPDDPQKKDPLDFVLWQASTPGEPSWKSPWGKGRPGWHIECSTMAALFLGMPIDIHGGGADLIFPHHECEISQAKYTDSIDPFARFWVHIAMVQYQGEKMSKSLGNLIMVRDLLDAGYPADAIRLLFARYHYREAWIYAQSDLHESVKLAHTLKEAAWAEPTSGTLIDPEPYKTSFHNAMEDDLNTPAALISITELAEAILRAVHEGEEFTDLRTLLLSQCAIFGLRLDQPLGKEEINKWDEHRQKFAK